MKILVVMGSSRKGNTYRACEGVHYFVDVPVNPLYLTIGSAAGWFSARRVQKDLARGPGETA